LYAIDLDMSVFLRSGTESAGGGSSQQLISHVGFGLRGSATIEPFVEIEREGLFNHLDLGEAGLCEEIGDLACGQVPGVRVIAGHLQGLTVTSALRVGVGHVDGHNEDSAVMQQLKLSRDERRWIDDVMKYATREDSVKRPEGIERGGIAPENTIGAGSTDRPFRKWPDSETPEPGDKISAESR